MKRNCVSKLRQWIAAATAAVLLFTGSAALTVQRVEAVPPMTTNAAAAAVIDVHSGRMIYEQRGDDKLPIASITKVMTAIIAIEHGELSDKVKVGKNAYRKEGSSLYLHLGEEMTLETMLYGLMLRSGNDAATAIAEHVGGSQEGFVYLMNEKARMLGMKNTSFRNPHGLDEEGHYSSAKDMAVLAAYALKNPVFQEIAKTKVKSAPNPNEEWDYKWHNKNKMLSMYEGADGVKTGYTSKARRTLISSATRNGQQIAVVTLNDGDDWNDHRKLLDYAFEYYPLTSIVRKGETVEQPVLVAARSFEYPLAEGEIANLRKKIVIYEPGTTDYRLGQRGTLELYLKGERIASLPLYENGSERLKVQERTTFRHTELTDYKKRERTVGDIMRLLLQGLFTGSMSGE